MRDVTGGLDARITERTQTWWDPLPADRKARTRVTLWQLLPGSATTTQGLSVASQNAPAVQAGDNTEGIEGYEEVPEQFRGNVQRVMENLEVLRSELGDRSIRIVSGYRSCSQNGRVEGAERSRHLCPTRILR